MTFNPRMLQPIGGQGRSGNAAVMWAYTTTDNEAAVNAAGYFGDQRFAMRLGDIIFRTTLDGSGAHVETGLHLVTTKTPNLVQCITAVLQVTTGTGMPTSGGTFTGFVGYTTDDAVSAAGTIQADATALTKQYSTVTACAAGAGVRLPAVSGAPVGIHNATAETVKIWPDTGAKIADLATNANDSLEPGRSVILVKMGATQWRVFG